MVSMKNFNHQNQKGFVSFMMTLFIMIVLTLIVLGFAALTRREQRQALDDQLSTQAFYAAETGINDARKALAANPALSKTTCDLTGFPNSGVIDSTTNVAYTCLLVNSTPTSLEYGDIPESHSKAFPVKSSNGANITSINLSWQNPSTTSSTFNNINCPAAGSLTTVSAWSCDMPMLRVDIVPLNTLNRASLISNTMTIFISPQKSSGGSLTYNAGNTGAIAIGNCLSASTPKLCNLTITGLSQPGYYLRVRSIYKEATLTVTASDGTSSLALVGAQAIVDATGKAQDVLRRIQVRVPTLVNKIPTPDFAIQSTDTLCKRFMVAGGVAAATDQTGADGAVCDPSTP